MWSRLNHGTRKFHHAPFPEREEGDVEVREVKDPARNSPQFTLQPTDQFIPSTAELPAAYEFKKKPASAALGEMGARLARQVETYCSRELVALPDTAD